LGTGFQANRLAGTNVLIDRALTTPETVRPHPIHAQTQQEPKQQKYLAWRHFPLSPNGHQAVFNPRGTSTSITTICTTINSAHACVPKPIEEDITNPLGSADQRSELESNH
jgi:hypothetical protein